MIQLPDLNELNQILIKVQGMQDRINQIMTELKTTEDQTRIIQLNLELQTIVKELEGIKNLVTASVPTMSFCNEEKKEEK